MSDYIGALKKYAVFIGRASRSEYWKFLLVNFIIALVIAVFQAVTQMPPVLSTVYGLGVWLPSLAVAVPSCSERLWAGPAALGGSGFWS